MKNVAWLSVFSLSGTVIKFFGQIGAEGYIPDIEFVVKIDTDKYNGT
ncbi:hypothetical protein [Bacteroides sp.]|nr:hypothetical protein [Bacteroides sp.]MDD3039203.1 hypothetical protein [Bacteroides sp.]